jgi:hypothetical protein
MSRLLLAALALLLSPIAVAAQSTCSYIAYGAVLTPAQWNQCFSNKADTVIGGYLPLLGGAMAGKLITAAPSTVAAGFNLPPGTPPTTPINGDMWSTSAGFFGYAGGVTYGPFASGSAGSFAATVPLAVTFPSSVVTYALNYNSTLTLDGSNNLEINLAHSNSWSAAQSIAGLTVTTSFTATGLVTNGDLANSSITLGGTSVALGGTTGVSGTPISALYLSSPVLTTPTLGIAVGTSLALGGGSIGSNALEVTGTTALNGAISVVGASFGLSGNISGSGIFGTAGIRYANVAGTLSDTTSSGTIAAIYGSVFGGETFTASNATTATNLYSDYFKAPICSTNVTCTAKWALGVDSAQFNGNVNVASGNYEFGGTQLGYGNGLAGFGTAAAQNTGTSGANIGLLNGNNTFSGTDTFSSALTASTSITTPTLTLGTQQSVQGTLVLANTVAHAYSTTIESSNSATAAYTMVLPSALNGSGPVVLTDALGNGVLSWASPSAASSIGVTSTSVTTASGSNQILTTGTVSGGTGTLANATIASLLTQGAGITITGTTNATIAQSLSNATLQHYPTNPTGVTSTTPAMMGLGKDQAGSGASPCAITPVYSGRLLVIVTTNFTNSGTAATQGRLYYGTGTAPSNGASATGTTASALASSYLAVANATETVSISSIITGLSPGTAYWLDLALNSSVGTDTAAVQNVSCSAMEF